MALGSRSRAVPLFPSLNRDHLPITSNRTISATFLKAREQSPSGLINVTGIGIAHSRVDISKNNRRVQIMSIARITEISSTSKKSFEDAIQTGVTRATETLRNVRSAWVKEQQIRIENGTIIEYQVNLMITFVLDDGDRKDIA
jgi:flavin-binding protein dodecin